MSFEVFSNIVSSGGRHQPVPSRRIGELVEEIAQDDEATGVLRVEKPKPKRERDEEENARVRAFLSKLPQVKEKKQDE